MPIVSVEDPTVIEKDPLGWISNQRKTGKITMLVRGKKDFITTSLPADKVGEVAQVDDAVKQEKAEEFRGRLDRLQNGDMARDAPPGTRRRSSPSATASTSTSPR